MARYPTTPADNFNTLMRAADDGNLALMECTDARTGEPRYVLCAVHRHGTEYAFTPLGHLAGENPVRPCTSRLAPDARGDSHTAGEA